MVKKKIKLSVAGFMAVIMLTAAPALAGTDNNNGDDNPGNNITFCHATGSKTNPYDQITANANGIVNGHAGHQDENDIIPPFDYTHKGKTQHFDGLNWDTQGQAIFNNGCKVGGQGGGTTETTTPPTNQVATNLTQAAGAGGQAAPQAVAAQGGVAAGAGGARVTSTEAVIGLVGSVGTIASGLVLARKF